MNCDCSRKTSTASLYRNGVLIEQASASFTVCNGNGANNDIDLQLGYNRCGNILRICSFIRNDDNIFVDNAIVRVRVCCDGNRFWNRVNNSSRNNCCNCCSYYDDCRCKEFNLCGLCPGVTRQICFNLDRNCCRCYRIEAEVLIDNEVVARECLRI